MKSLMIMSLWLLAWTSSVLAQMSTVPTNVSVVARFDGERDLHLILPGGVDRHYVWASNETHADDTFDYTHYATFDEAKACPKTATALAASTNVTNRLDDLLGVCETTFTLWNQTRAYLVAIEAADEARDNCTIQWQAEQERRITQERLRATYENQSATVAADRDKYRADWEGCTGRLTSCEARTTPDCGAAVAADRDQRGSNGPLFFVLGVLGGGVASHFYQRQKRVVPKEAARHGVAGKEYPQLR